MELLPDTLSAPLLFRENRSFLEELILKAFRLNGEGRARGMVNEPFGRGAEKEGLETGAPASPQNDEVSFHILECLPNTTMNAVGSDDLPRDLFEFILFRDSLRKSGDPFGQAIFNALLLGDGKSRSQPPHLTLGVNRRTVNMDQFQAGLILGCQHGGTVNSPIGVLREVHAGHDVVEGMVLIVTNEKDFDRSFTNATGSEGPHMVTVFMRVSSGSQNKSFGIVLFDLIESQFEWVPQKNFGDDVVGGTDDVADEPGNFLMSKVEDTFFSLRVHFFDLSECLLVEDVKADHL